MLNLLIVGECFWAVSGNSRMSNGVGFGRHRVHTRRSCGSDPIGWPPQDRAPISWLLDEG